MSVKSLDLQITLPRLQDVGRIQHVQQFNEHVQQQSFALSLAKESEISQRTVKDSPQAKEGKYLEERQRKKHLSEQKPNTNDKRKTQKNVNEETSILYSNILGSNIDLKI